tara:strand:+ start:2185 stop:6999 length:4815 start_codon:yes stop_codon:yes gene_type:complete
MNNQSTVSYIQLPETNLINTATRTYPFSGFACNEFNTNDNLNYFITSSIYPNFHHSYSQNSKCIYTKKYVEIIKYNVSNHSIVNNIIIGENNVNYPTAIGNKGSDNVVSCGIYNDKNMLYYIASNKYNCESSYSTDSSLVRIDLNTFNFIDRTIFRNFQNKSPFATYSYYEYKYIFAPTTSILLNDILWVSFGTNYGGIWKLNITETPVKLLDQYQKKYMVSNDDTVFKNTDISNTYETNIREIKKSFIIKEKQEIYFIEDTGYSDAKILIINYSKPLNDNTTQIKILDGINYISDIKIDKNNQFIYVVSGSLNSELYKLDFNFDKVSLNMFCDIDFLKFPSEWGVITNIQLDLKTGYIYAIISTRYPYYGIVKINIKDMKLDMNSYSEFYNIVNFETYSYNIYLQHTNITSLQDGKLIILGNQNTAQYLLVDVDLYGCAEGRGFSTNHCSICEQGKYSNKVGGICIDCPAGYANEDYESSECEKCSKGQFTNGVHTIYCNDCPAGYYNEFEGQNNCKSCSRGKYSIVSSSSNKDDCLNCDDGKISNSGDITCIFCQTGRWTNDGILCKNCTHGKYSNAIGLISDDDCELCPIGKYNDLLGISNENNCKTCMNGKIGIIEGAKSNQSCIKCDIGMFKSSLYHCESCPNGWISINKENRCDQCPIGKWALDKHSCVDCPKGKYSFSLGLIDHTECLLCSKGKYQPLTGQITENSCLHCPDGKIGTIKGAISNKSCVACDSGRFKSNDIDCDECPNGWISTYLREFCVICQRGMYNNLNKNFCEKCPQGRYNEQEGAMTVDDCIKCDMGTWNNIDGQMFKDDCKGCLPGLYGNEMGMISIGSCKECPAGKFNENYGLAEVFNCKECSTGRYSIAGSLMCIPCQPGTFTITMGSPKCEYCPEGKYSRENSSYICNNCPENSEQNNKKTGCICSKNTYDTFYNYPDLNCIQCNNTFSCDKNTNIETIVLKENFWRNSKKSTNIYKCKNRYACKGGIIYNNSNDLCAEGSMGALCNVCKKGWAKDDGVCLKCPEHKGRTISLTVIIPVVSVIIIIFLIKTANPSNNKKEEVNGVVKIFMNYAQVFSLASSFEINWPSLIRYLFERAKEFSSPRVSFYSSDCAIGWSYYDKLLVYLILPLFYIIAVTIIIFLISLCYCSRKKKKIKQMRRHKSQIEIEEYEKNRPNCLTFFIAWEKTAIVVGTFLSWPTIVTKTLEVMNCEKIDDTYYLVRDYSVVCYDTKHYTYLSVAYASLILYGLGIPLLGFKLLYNYRYRLFDMQNRYDGSTPLSFLFLGYREKRWYYEFIIMGKKAGLIIMSVFLKSYPRYQIIAASLLVQISFFLHVFLRPYDTITSYGIICNRLESISLLSLVMTLSTGLFFGTIDSGYKLGTFEDVLIVILILCNGGISFYFLTYFIRLGFKSAKNQIKEHLSEDFKKNRIPCFLRCCNISHKNLQALKYWSYSTNDYNYGISLHNNLEKEIFANYYTEKKEKLNTLNSKLDNIKKRRVSVQLDKLRSDIQVMEKERCWQTIQNNRLYKTLKNITTKDKSSLSNEDKKNIKEIFKFYINQGIQYNEKMNNLYMNELTKMINDDDEFINEIVRDISNIEQIII